MWIRTQPASASISLEDRAPTNEGAVTTQEIVSLKLLPEDEDHRLYLDTGEVFWDYGYAKLFKEERKLISASITISAVRGESDHRYNQMGYIRERRGAGYDDYDVPYPSSIHFRAHIAPAAFRQLADNIRNGLLPETISIELTEETNADPKKAPLEYGPGPDGLTWHNKEKEWQRILIEGITFDYEVVKPRYDEKQTDRLLPIRPDSPTLSGQISLIQATVADMSKRLRWTTIGIVVLVMMIGVLIAR